LTSLLKRAAATGAAVLCLAAFSACSPPNNAPKSTPASLTVEVTQPQSTTWPRQIHASGALAAWQEAVISAETGSLRITSLQADVGSWVKRGNVLATLSRDTLLADRDRLQGVVAEAQANLAQADSDVARAAQVGASGALSAQQIQKYEVTQRTARATLQQQKAQLRATEIQLQQTNVVAVDDGVISSRSALLGKVATAGDELFRLVRQGRIEWHAELNAQQLAQVKAGQAAQVTLPDGQRVAGAVRLVSPTLSTTTSRGIAYVQLPPGSAARAGMYGDGVINVGSARVLTLPDTALVLRDGRAYVFVVDADKRVRQQQVATGDRRDGKVEVRGLAPSASVVKSGASFLSDGVTVRVAAATSGAAR